jgi:hypothetical protein
MCLDDLLESWWQPMMSAPVGVISADLVVKGRYSISR